VQPWDRGGYMRRKGWTWLKKVEIFKGLSEKGLKAVHAYMEERGYPAGQTIYEEDQRGGNLYFIKSGKVRVFRRGRDVGEHELAIMGAGSIFGEMTFFDRGKHTANVATIEDVVIGVLKLGQFEVMAKKNPALAYLITKGLLLETQRIMRNMNAQYVALMEYMYIFGK